VTQLGPRIGIFDKPQNYLIMLVYGSRIRALASVEPLSTLRVDTRTFTYARHAWLRQCGLLQA
jgi:hypothetical protein